MKTRWDFFMFKEMYKRGMVISDIASELKIYRKTVKKYITSDDIPSPKKRNRTSKLDKFKGRLTRGCWRTRSLTQNKSCMN